MRALFICLMTFPMVSCAYKWGHQSRELPNGHKTVFIDMFENKSQEVGAEAAFTQALTREFQRSGFARVTNKETADVIVKGTILSAYAVGSSPIGRFFNPDHRAGTAGTYDALLFAQYDLFVQASVKAIQASDKKVLWQSNLQGQRTFRGSELTRAGVRSSNVLYNQSRRSQTMGLIANDMMQDAFDRFTENF